MPIRKPCGRPGCAHSKPCPDHAERTYQPDTKTEDERRFYSSTAWKRKRREVLDREPLCRECKKRGLYIAATTADHIVAMRDGGAPLDDDNLQPLCTPCHNAKRARERAARVGGGS